MLEKVSKVFARFLKECKVFLQNVQDVQGFCKVFARFCKVCKVYKGFLLFVIIKSNKMSRSKFEPENMWKVNDIEYEDVNSDNYVYPTARRVAPVA